MTIQCCICKKIKVEDGWAKGGIESRSDASHTYCPVCLQQSATAMRAEQRQANLSQSLTA